MKVDDLVSRLPSIKPGVAVDVEGIFVMIRGVGYFVSSLELKDDTGAAILVKHGNLERCLLGG